jgi:fibronectin-binding autotransporter adhesin
MGLSNSVDGGMRQGGRGKASLPGCGQRAIDVAFAAARCASGCVMGVGQAGGWSRTLAAVLIATMAGRAVAGPEGATVIRGDVSITRNGAETLIRAGRDSIINYRNFDIGASETVRFMQPDAQSRVLNRIYSAAPTRIDGSLLANGRVYIVNPAGVMFSGSARVDVNRLYAAAGNISDNDFMRGVDRFTDMQGRVVNEGIITANFVGLLGESVGNYGQIIAPQGTVVMAAGEDVIVGDRKGNIFVKVDGKTAASANGAEAAIENQGSIDARGGTVSMAAGDIYSLALRVDGNVRAKRVKMQAKSGEVHVQGTIDASATSGGGAGEKGKGGRVEVLGEKIALHQGSVIDASGTTGGGTVRIGGDIQGKGAMQTADAVFTAPGSTVRADAIDAGKGGSVVVWSDTISRVYGDISARGGEQGGNGGFIETSSKGILDLNVGTFDAAAPKGQAGQWLIDPINVTISNAASVDVTAAPNFNPDASGANVDVAAIQGALNAGTSVTVTTTPTGVDPGEDGNITVQNAISKTAGGNATLTLTAANNITVDPGATIGSTTGTLGVTFTAGGAVNVGATINTNGGIFQSSGTTFNNTAVITSTGGATLSHSGVVTLGAALDGTGSAVSISGSSTVINGALTGATVNLSGGAVSQDAAGVVTATTVTLAGTGGADLSVAANAIDALQGTKAGDISLQNTVATTTGTGLTSTGGSVTLNTAANTLGVTGGLSATGGEVTLISGDLTQSGPIATQQLTLGGGGSATLNDGTNSIGRLVGSKAGAISVTNNGTMAVGSADGVQGLSTTNSNITLNVGTAALTISGEVNAGTGDVSLTAGSVSQTAGIIGNDLVISSAGNGNFTLTNVSNAFDTIEGAVGGALSVFNTRSFTVTGAGVSTTNGGGLSLESAGTLTINAAATAGVGNQATLTTDTLAFGGGGTVVGSNITYRTRTAGRTIGIGTGAVGASSIVDADLSKFVTSGTLTVGRNDSGLESGNVSTANLNLSTQGYGLSIFSGANIDVGGLLLAASRLLSTNAAGTTNFSGAVNASGVNITSVGAVTQSAAITTGTLTISGGVFTLANPSNDIDTLTGSGTLNTVSVADTDGFDVTGLTSTGTITLTNAAGTVTQSGAIVAPTLTLAGAGAFTLANTGNDVDALNGGNASSAISFRDTDGVAVGTLAASTLTLQAGGEVTQTGAITATTLILTGANVFTLTNPGNNITTLQGSGTVGATSYTDTNGFDVAGLTSSGTITLTNAAGTVTQSGAIVAPTLTLAGAGAFTLANSSNDVDALNGGNASSAISFRDTDGVAVGTLAASTLTLQAGGEVTQTGAITATTLILTGANVFTLTNPGNNITTLQGSGTVGATSYTDTNGFDVAGLTSSGTVTLTNPSGTVTQSGAIVAPTLTLAGAGTFTFGLGGNDIDTLSGGNAASNITFVDSDGLALGTLAAATLDLNGGGNVTQSGALTAATLTLRGTNTYTLNNTGNNVNLLQGATTLGTVEFTEANGFDLGGFTSTTSLTLNSLAGTVTQSGALDVPTLNLQGAGTFILGNGGNAFTTVTAANVGNASITENSGFQLGATSVTGTLTILSSGNVTQSVGMTAGALQVGGGGNFTLSSANDVDSFGGASSVTSVNFADTDGYVLRTLTATSAVTLDSAGAVLQIILNNAITVPTLTLSNAGPFFLNQGNNVTTLNGTGLGTASYRDTDGFTLGTISATSLTLQGGAAVTQGGPATVGSLTLLGNVSYTLDDVNNDFDTVGGTSIGSLTLVDTDGFGLAALSSNGAVSLTAGGAVTQSGALTATVLTLVGNTSFTIGNTGNDIDTLATTGSVASLTFVDSDGFDIAGIGASGAIALTGTGTVTQSGGITADTLTLNGAATYTLLDSGNDVNTIGANSITALSFDDSDGYAVGGLAASGNVTLLSGGAVTQAGVLSAQTLTLGGTGPFTLDNTGNTIATLTSQGTAPNVTLSEANGFDLGAYTGGDLSLLVTSGNVTQSAAFTVGTLDLDGGANYTLTNTGNVLTTATGTLTGAGSVDLFGNSYSAGPISAVNGSITLRGGILTIGATVGSTGSSVALIAGGSITVNAPVTAGTTIQIASPTVDIAADTTSTGATQINADTLTVTGVVSGSQVTISGQSVARSIGVAGGAGDLQITNTILGNLNTSSVAIGAGDTGAITANSFDLNSLGRDYTLQMRGATISLQGVTMASGNPTSRLTLQTETGGITQTGVDAIATRELVFSSAAGISLGNSNAIVTAEGTAAGAVTITNGSLTALTVGVPGLTDGITSGGNAIELTAPAGITIDRAVNAGASRVTLNTDVIAVNATVTGNATSGGIRIAPTTLGTSIGLGTGAGTLSLTQSEINNLSTTTSLIIGSTVNSGVLTISNASFTGLGSASVCLTGQNIVVDGLFGPTGAALVLENTAGNVTQSPGFAARIEATALATTGTGLFTLTNPSNQVQGFASNTSGGIRFVTTGGPLNIVGISADCLSSPVVGIPSVAFLCADILNIAAPVGGSVIRLKADTMAVTANVTATDSIEVSTFTAVRAVQLGGTDNAGALTIESAEFGRLIATNEITIGDLATGAMTIASDLVLAGTYDLTLVGAGITFNGGLDINGRDLSLGSATAGGNVTQNTGNIIADDLTLGVGGNAGDYSLESAGNNVSSVSGSVNGAVAYNDIDALTVGGLTATDIAIGAGATTVTGTVDATPGDAVFLTATFGNTGTVTATGEVTIEGDEVAIDNTVTGEHINIRQRTNGLNITVGDEVGGTVSINDAELAFLDTAGTVTLGNSDTGSMAFVSVDLPGLSTPRSYSITALGTAVTITGGALVMDSGDVLALLTTGGVTQDGSSPISASGLFIDAGAAVTLENTANAIGSFAADATGGAVSVRNADGTALDVSSVTYRFEGAPVTELGIDSDNQNITLQAAAGLQISERVNAGTGAVVLTTDALALVAPTGGGATIIGNFVGSVPGTEGPGVTIRVATAGTPIFVGTTGTGLEISQTEINLLSTTSGLVITQNGGTSAFTLGDVTFAGLAADVCLTGAFTNQLGAITGPASRSLILEHTGNTILTQSGALVAFNLGLTGSGGFNLLNTGNSVTGTFAGAAGLGNTIVNSGALTVGTVSAQCGGSPIQPNGSLDLCAPSVTVSTAISSGGSVRIKTDSLAVNANVTSATGTTIENLNPGRPIFLGSGTQPADTLALDNAELGRLRLANDTLLTIGSATAGAVTINNALFSGNTFDVSLDGASFAIENGIAADVEGRTALQSLRLRARTGGVQQGELNDGILAGGLTLVGDTEGGNFTLFNDSNNVSELSADVKGTLAYIDTNTLTIVEPGVVTTNDDATLVAPTGLTTLAGAPINIGEGLLTLTANEMAIAGAITGNGGISISTFTEDRDINIAVGADIASSLNLASEELALINSTRLVTIGRDVSSAGVLTFGSVNLTGTGLNRDFSLHLLGRTVNLQSLALKADKALVVKSTAGAINIDGSIVAPGTTLVATALDGLSGVHGFTALANGGVINFGGSVTTAGDAGVTTSAFPISLQGDVVLVATNTTLSSGAAGDNSNVSFSGTIVSANGERNNLTINSPTIVMAGAVGGASDGTGQLGTFTSDVGGILTFRGGTFRTAGTITIGENLVLAPTTGNETTFDATAGTGGSIDFRGTINSDSAGTPRALVVNSGGTVGNTLFGGNVGETVVLSSLATNANGTTFLPSIVRTTGDQTYLDDVRLVTDTVLTAGLGDTPRAGATGGLSELSDINFDRRINGSSAAFNLTVNADGVSRFGGDVGSPIGGDETALGLASLTTDSAGSTTVNADITTSVRQTFNDAVTITSEGAASVFTGNGVTFNNGLNSDLSDEGRGAIISGSLNGVIINNGAGAIRPLASLTASGASVTINGSSTVPTDAVKTIGSQSYTVGESVNDRLTITNNITAGGDFDVRGKATISGNILARNVRFRRVNDASGTLAPVNLTGNITSQNSGSEVLFTDALVLGQDTTVTRAEPATTELNVTFAGTVDSSAGATRALTVTTPGVTTFGGAVGATERLSTLLTNGGGSTVLNGGSIATSSAVTITDNAVVGANTTIATRDVNFGGTVNNATGDRRTLTVTLASTGTAVFNSAVGNSAPLGAITVGNTGRDGTITLASPITLGGDLTLNGSAVTLASTVNNAAGVRHAMTIGLGTSGTALLSGALGDTAPLGNITIGNTGLDGTITLASPVTLGGNLTLNGRSITVASTVNNAVVTTENGETRRDIAINMPTSGTATLSGAIGASQTVGRLLINNQTAVAGTVRIGSNITSTGMVFGSSAVLTNDVTLNATTGTIFFRGNVSSDSSATPRALTLRSNAALNAVADPTLTDVVAGITTGTTVTPFRFGGSVGTGARLRTLDIDSAAQGSPKGATIVFAPQATTGTGGYNASGVILPYLSGGVPAPAPAVSVEVTESFVMGRGQKLTSFGSFTLDAGSGSVRIADVNVLGAFTVIANTATVAGAANKTSGNTTIFRNEANGAVLLERDESDLDLVGTESITFRRTGGAPIAVNVDGQIPVFITNDGLSVTVLGSVGLGRPVNDQNNFDNAGFGNFTAPGGGGLLPLDLFGSFIFNSATALAGAIPRNNQEREVTQAVVLSGAFAKPLENMGFDLYQNFTLGELADYLAGRSIYQDAERNTAAGVEGRTIVTINRLINQATLEAIEVYCSVFYENGEEAFAAFASGNNEPAGDRTTQVQEAIRTAWEEYLKDAGAAANGVEFRQQLELGKDGATENEKMALEYLNGARQLFEKIDNLGLSPYEVRVARDAIVEKLGGPIIGADILEAAIVGKSGVAGQPGTEADALALAWAEGFGK